MFISVSKFIKQYKEPFDTDRVANFCAERDGIAVKEVLADWDLKRQHGIRRGNVVHRYIEETIKTGNSVCNDPEHAGHCFQFRSWYKNNQDRYDWSNAKIEYRMKDVTNKLTGVVDLIVHDIIDNVLVIIEWKTSKKFDCTSQNMMLAPFDHLHDSHLTLFSMQLELYRRIFMKKALRDLPEQQRLLIVRFTSDSAQEIKAIDLSAEVDTALELRKGQV